MEFDTTNGALKKEYVYGASGLLATIDATNGAQYMTADHLGSPRVVTNGTGAVVSRHDYKPFGRELMVGDGGRTQSQGYSQFDGVRQRYTGAERDDEIGLDFMLARYYSSIQGRFTSPDPLYFQREMLTDPQRYNLYAYVRNNPLAFIDPTGMKIDTRRLNEKDLGRWNKIKELANATDKNGNLLHPELNKTLTKLESDERTFYIQGGKLGGSRGGLFEVETFNGDNDFSAARITLDFDNIKSAEVAPANDGDFKQVEGLETNEERFAEFFGHEGTHALDAINDPANAVRVQRLINEEEERSRTRCKPPQPPSEQVKSDRAELKQRLENGERSAYGREKIILQELRASKKQR